MKYFKNILIIFLLAIVFHVQGQQILSPNLVNNPSFEEYDTCPFWLGQLYKSKYWWGYSTDYFNSCANMYVSIPSNYDGYQFAHSGNAYSGTILYANNFTTEYDYREAIKTKLNDSLIANKRYCTNYYISLGEYSYTFMQNAFLLLDSIGTICSKDLTPDIDTAFISNGIKIQNSIFNIDTVNWFKISNSFIANGGEQYLTIGNFDNTINWPSGKTGLTYVYVDDVSICECSFKFNLGNDTTLCIGQSFILNPNIPNATYTWQDGSHGSTYTVTHAGTYYVSAYFADYNITSTDTINISYYPSPIVNLGNDTTLCKGQTLILNDKNKNYIYLWKDGTTAKTDTVTQQGIYWLKVTDNNNCTASDTVNILYKDCDTTDNIISIYPNPAIDNLTIETNSNDEDRLEIINLLGQCIYSTYIYRKGIINTSDYACGVYILKLYTNNGMVVKKFVKE